MKTINNPEELKQFLTEYWYVIDTPSFKAIIEGTLNMFAWDKPKTLNEAIERIDFWIDFFETNPKSEKPLWFEQTEVPYNFVKHLINLTSID